MDKIGCGKDDCGDICGEVREGESFTCEDCKMKARYLVLEQRVSRIEDALRNLNDIHSCEKMEAYDGCPVCAMFDAIKP